MGIRVGARIAFAVAALSLGACTRYDYNGSFNIPPAVGILTTPGEMLAQLPPPERPIRVAVYDFQDLTGQNKSSFNVGYAEFSRAITQGSSTILVDALKTAGRGRWFKVGERGYLDSLLRERRLIQETFAVLKKDPRSLIDPLTFAEYLITGGVVSYDAPIANAGVAGGFAGYTGGVSGHKDLVTVNVRLVRVRDGVVVSSINASRPIITVGASAAAARILHNSIVEAQVSAGLAEATQTAVREAIETAVYEVVRQHVNSGNWPLAGTPVAAADASAPGPGVALQRSAASRGPASATPSATTAEVAVAAPEAGAAAERATPPQPAAPVKQPDQKVAAAKPAAKAESPAPLPPPRPVPSVAAGTAPAKSPAGEPAAPAKVGSAPPSWYNTRTQFGSVAPPDTAALPTVAPRAVFANWGGSDKESP